MVDYSNNGVKITCAVCNYKCVVIFNLVSLVYGFSNSGERGPESIKIINIANIDGTIALTYLFLIFRTPPSCKWWIALQESIITWQLLPNYNFYKEYHNQNKTNGLFFADKEKQGVFPRSALSIFYYPLSRRTINLVVGKQYAYHRTLFIISQKRSLKNSRCVV